MTPNFDRAKEIGHDLYRVCAMLALVREALADEDGEVCSGAYETLGVVRDMIEDAAGVTSGALVILTPEDAAAAVGHLVDDVTFAGKAGGLPEQEARDRVVQAMTAALAAKAVTP